MSRTSKFACLACGLYYSVTGGLLFFTPSFFFHRVAPIGIFNEHYAVDLGSFLFPLGVFLLLAVRYPDWSQPIIGVAAFGSALHLVSHLRDGLDSPRAVIADVFFLVVALLLVAPLVIRKNPLKKRVI